MSDLRTAFFTADGESGEGKSDCARSDMILLVSPVVSRTGFVIIVPDGTSDAFRDGEALPGLEEAGVCSESEEFDECVRSPGEDKFVGMLMLMDESVFV